MTSLQPPAPSPEWAFDPAAVAPRLLAWYGSHGRDLPWRHTRDPYRVWLAEIMLQQTTVAAVIPYYQRFLGTFPDVAALAAAPLEQVIALWAGLGYYSRARNLHRAARMLTADGNGPIPDRWEEFRALPGVGDYIAAAVLSIAFDRPHAVVDGNVKRVLARLRMIAAPANQSASRKIFQAEADRLLDARRPGDFNQALMELGALVCTPAAPNCAACPLIGCCCAHRSGAVGRYPRRVASRPVPEEEIAVGVVSKGDRMLITRRAPQGLLGGLWEFPGGKLRTGERPEAACVREIKEEVNLDVVVEKPLAQVRHAYSHLRIRLHVFACRFAAGRVRLNGPVGHRWIRIAEIDRFAFPKANHRFIPLLKQRAAEDSAPPGRERSA